MNEFIEKLIGSLEEEIKDVSESQSSYEVGSDMSITCSHIMGTLRDVKNRIIPKLAEEYNGGWISVKDRLPRQNEEVLATLLIKGKPLVIVITYDHLWLDDGLNKLIAWQPLPAPYNLKGE